MQHKWVSLQSSSHSSFYSPRHPQKYPLYWKPSLQEGWVNINTDEMFRHVLFCSFCAYVDPVPRTSKPFLLITKGIPIINSSSFTKAELTTTCLAGRWQMKRHSEKYRFKLLILSVWVCVTPTFCMSLPDNAQTYFMLFIPPNATVPLMVHRSIRSSAETYFMHPAWMHTAIEYWMYVDMHIQSEQQRLRHRRRMNISNIRGFLSPIWTGFICLEEVGRF